MRGSITKRCDCGKAAWARCRHSWRVVASGGFDPVTGRRVQRSSRVPGLAADSEGRLRGTRPQAEKELTRLQGKIDRGRFADPGSRTLAGYLQTDWLPHIATRVRPRTHLRYSQLIGLHVIPRIGAVRLGKLRPAHVQKVVDGMLAAGLAPRTTAQAYRTLFAALRQAVRWELLDVNVAAAIQPPRADRTRPTVPDAATVTRILEAARGSRLHVPLVLAATTGMRRGEFLALRWGQLDLDAGLARVVASLQVIAGEFRFMEPKTDRARRTVALPPLTVELLRRHRKEQAERRLMLGEAWQDFDLVLDQGDGGPLSPDALSRAFYRLVRTIGLPGLRLHDLRHAYATTLLKANVHPKVASEALGHSSVSFTMDVYSHVMPGMQEEAAKAIEQALGGLAWRAQ
jgi:integrase